MKNYYISVIERARVTYKVTASSKEGAWKKYKSDYLNEETKVFDTEYIGVEPAGVVIVDNVVDLP